MSLDTYTPTTELEAVNAILAAANEAPVESLESAAGRADVALAQDALAAALRETMEQRWRFNSDINYKLTGTAVGGAFVYPEPAGLMAFTLTPTESQAGLDIAARPSRTYEVGGSKVRILANRIGGSDTLAVGELFINPVWSVPFSLAPEVARRFIVRSAVRRRVQESGVSKEQLQGVAADEQAAAVALGASESPRRAQQRVAGFGSETDALNTILTSCGKEGVADVMEADGEALTALAELRQAVVDVCSMGWRFNTENGMGVAPVPNVFYNWPDVDGTTSPVLIYLAPANLLSATATVCEEQTGSKAIDINVQPATLYTDNGVKPRVVYDRINHRDGFPAGDRTVLWLDVTLRKPFADMPEQARRYATILAARRFAPAAGADPRWTMQDEEKARIALQQAEGTQGKRNLFNDNASIRAFRGRRTRY